MKVCHIFFCFIFLHLQDGSSDLINGETVIHGVEGGNITVQCKFGLTGFKMMLCKENCKKGNVLIETTKNKDQSGRYSIEFIRNYLSRNIVNVNITQLKKSDSGRYRCKMDRIAQESHDDFKIVVTASSTSPSDVKPQPFTASASTTATTTTATTTTTTTTTTATTTTTQHLNFRSGSSTPPSASPETMTKSSGSGPDLLLYVILILVVMITLLSAALLMFCKKRWAIKAKGLSRRPVETEYSDITQANQLYEEIREGDRANSSLPVEAFSIYTTAKCPQADGAENKDLYSLATSPQNKAEDDITEVDYTEVDFSHRPAANSAPCGKADDVVYATPLLHASVTGDASPPL